MEQKFYVCEDCGTVITTVTGAEDLGAGLGKNWRELVPGTTDAAQEKHVPVYKVEGSQVRVNVGSLAHPMEDAHSIEWVVLKTKQGSQQKFLLPGGKPEACFALCEGDQVEAVYAYCNLHGLWKA